MSEVMPVVQVPFKPRPVDSKFIRADELMKRNITELPTLFGNVIPRCGLIAIAGSSDTGKSIIQRQLAICTAAGLDFLGWTNKARHRSVIIVSTEDDENAISFLLNKQNRTLSLSENVYRDIRYIFDTDNLINDLNEALNEAPADLIVIDSYGDVFNGKDSNIASQVRPFLSEYKKIALAHDCLISFLHHTGKRTEDYTPSKNSLIGSQSFEAVMRLVFELRTDKENPNWRHLCIVKGNYLSSEYKNSSFVLELDENLVFSNTNNRTSFEELATINNQKQSKKGKNPGDYPNEEHTAFIHSIFPSDNTNYSGRGLNLKIMSHFGISDQTARSFVDYYEFNNWIQNISDNGNKKYIKYDNKLPF